MVLEKMARHLLTDSNCRSASKTLHDGRGLYLRVEGEGKHWVYRYQLKGKRTHIGLGPYPAISLAGARQRHREAETLVKTGIHPRDHYAVQKRRGAPLREVAVQFLATRQKLKGGGEAGRWMSPLEQHVFPALGDMPLIDLTVENVSDALRAIWQDKHPTGVKALTRLGQIVRWEGGRDVRLDVELSKRVAQNLGEVAHKIEHHRAIDWRKAPAVYAQTGDGIVQLGLRFLLLTVVRVQNVTKAVWGEIDGDVWNIPGDRMKTGAPFRVPLSAEAVHVLEAARRLSGGKGYIFPSPMAYKKGVISENAFGKFFNSKGFNTTAHGWRSTFREWCVSQGVNDYLAEVCLQHEKRQRTVAAYQREDRLDQRRPVMDAWSAWCVGERARQRVLLSQERRIMQAVEKAELEEAGVKWDIEDRGDKLDWER